MAVGASVDAGWYRDPSGRYHERWWDGTAWTGHVRGHRADPMADTIEIAAVRATPTPVTAADRSPSFWSRWSAPVLLCVYGGALGLVVGALLPWVKVSGDVIDSTNRGIDGDGVITLALALLLASGFTLLKDRRVAAMGALGIGAVAAVVAAYELFDVSRAVGDLPPGLDASATPGIGLLLTGIAAVAIAVGAAVALGEADDGQGARRRSGEDQASEGRHPRRLRRHAPRPAVPMSGVTRSARSGPRTTARATRSSTRS